MTTVLIIDDDEATRRLMRLALSFGDFEIRTFPSAIEALEEVAERAPDAILVDYQMPVMDGGAFVREARALGVTAPIIMVSAWPQARSVKEADRYISKPFDPDELLRTVTEVTRAA
jgi:two-component system response regulator PrrA